MSLKIKLLLSTIMKFTRISETKSRRPPRATEKIVISASKPILLPTLPIPLETIQRMMKRMLKLSLIV